MRRLAALSQGLLEKNMIPDGLTRFGIRGLLSDKLKEERKRDRHQAKEKLVEELKESPIAISIEKANEQHYEMPTEFFLYVLGKNLKYSSCYFPTGKETLDEAEDIMLEITCERAQLADGQDVLELGCGWGSLSLYMAKKYPNSRIIGVSNSRTQKEFIDKTAQERGLENLEIITRDMNVFDIDRKFDRVVSVEMFEHMRNYQKLLKKVAGFLKPDGKLFVHIFSHKDFAYYYNEKDDSDWIAKYFFTGGIMPSDDLFSYFQEDLKIASQWQVSGHHYQLTSECWLKNMDKYKDKIMPIMEKTYGKKDALKWWSYWRVFFMSCAELWGYAGGREWIVSHYLFEKAK